MNSSLHAYKNLGSPRMAVKSARCRFSTSCPWMTLPRDSYMCINFGEGEVFAAEEGAEAPSEVGGVVAEEEGTGGGEGCLEREDQLAEDAPDLTAVGRHVVAEAGGQVRLQLGERVGGRGGG